MPKPSKSLILLGFLFGGIVKTFPFSQSSSVQPGELFTNGQNCSSESNQATFNLTSANNSGDLAYIRQRLDLALFYRSYSLYEFASELRRNDIDLVAPSRKDNQPFDLIYVDHRNKTAAAGRSLGEAYTADNVLCTIDKAIDEGLEPSLQKAPELSKHVEPYGSGFNTRVPQPIYDALEPDIDWDGYQQNLHLGRRIGR